MTQLEILTALKRKYAKNALLSCAIGNQLARLEKSPGKGSTQEARSAYWSKLFDIKDSYIEKDPGLHNVIHADLNAITGNIFTGSTK